MQLDVVLAGVAGVLVRVNCMAMGDVSVMGRRFVAAPADLLGRDAVVFGSLFMMLGSPLVVLFSIPS